LAEQRSYGGQMRQMLGEEVDEKKELAAGTMMAFNSMGKAMGAHVTALAQGRETVGEALKGMLADTLSSLGQMDQLQQVQQQRHPQHLAR
jgi:ABC-type phosphate transport system auxiliary subunit